MWLASSIKPLCHCKTAIVALSIDSVLCNASDLPPPMAVHSVYMLAPSLLPKISIYCLVFDCWWQTALLSIYLGHKIQIIVYISMILKSMEVITPCLT